MLCGSRTRTIRFTVCSARALRQRWRRSRQTRPRARPRTSSPTMWWSRWASRLRRNRRRQSWSGRRRRRRRPGTRRWRQMRRSTRRRPIALAWIWSRERSATTERSGTRRGRGGEKHTREATPRHTKRHWQRWTSYVRKARCFTTSGRRSWQSILCPRTRYWAGWTRHMSLPTKRGVGSATLAGAHTPSS